MPASSNKIVITIVNYLNKSINIFIFTYTIYAIESTANHEITLINIVAILLFDITKFLFYPKFEYMICN
jgi:hypothetical protein